MRRVSTLSLSTGLFLALACLGENAAAVVHVVNPDGSGEYPTIQGAVNSSTWGDVIELTDGVFVGPGNRDLGFHGKPVTIRSQSGNPETCVIDCQGSAADPHRGFVIDWAEGPGSMIQGITIKNGYATGAPPPDLESCGGGILIRSNASPTIQDVIVRDCTASDGGGVAAGESAAPTFVGCRFENNLAWWGGGGGVWGFFWSGSFTDCTFSGNHTLQTGGGLQSWHSGTLTLTNCWFRDNTVSNGYGAGFSAVLGEPVELEGCTFTGNSFEEGGFGGGLECGSNAALLIGCTFFGNAGSSGSSLAASSDGEVTAERCILAFGTDGGAAECVDGGGEITLNCCDIFGNPGGDYIGCVAGQQGINGNISEDPQFCDAGNLDLTLDADSPCAPENNPECGLIGAWPVGCGAAGVELTERVPASAAPLVTITPNPAVGTCRISFARPLKGIVNVLILDAAGRSVRHLCDIESGVRSGGETTWDGCDDSGRLLPSGVYQVFVRSAEEEGSQRVLWIR